MNWAGMLLSVEVFCEGDWFVVSGGDDGSGGVVWIGDQLDGSPLSFISTLPTLWNESFGSGR